jgi:hypothetical protein
VSIDSLLPLTCEVVRKPILASTARGELSRHGPKKIGLEGTYAAIFYVVVIVASARFCKFRDAFDRDLATCVRNLRIVH